MWINLIEAAKRRYCCMLLSTCSVKTKITEYFHHHYQMMHISILMYQQPPCFFIDHTKVGFMWDNSLEEQWHSYVYVTVGTVYWYCTSLCATADKVRSCTNRTNIWARMWMSFQVTAIQSVIQEVLVEFRARFCTSVHQDSFQRVPQLLQGTAEQLSCYKPRFFISPSFLS